MSKLHEMFYVTFWVMGFRFKSNRKKRVVDQFHIITLFLSF